MTARKVESRWTLEMIKESDWYNGEILSAEEL
jgi:hypothetical protein